MDGCPTFFAVPLPPATIPEISGPLWFYDDPVLCGTITFSELMDTTVEPKPEQLQFRVDAAVSDADRFEWGTDVAAQSQVDLPGLTPADVDMILPVEQNKYRTALGAKVPVYDLAAFHIIPTGIVTQLGPFTRFEITFNLQMDTGIMPLTTDFEMLLDGVPFAIGIITWPSSTVLRLDAPTSPTVPSVVSVELLGATNGLRSSTGSVMCPFFLEANFP